MLQVPGSQAMALTALWGGGGSVAADAFVLVLVFPLWVSKCPLDGT